MAGSKRKGTNLTMKIALASSPVITKDIQHNIFSILQAVEHCRGKADMVVFGEASLQGFDCLSWDYETDCHVAVSQEDSRIMQIRESAERNKIAVSFGYIEKTDEALFSSQMVIDPAGALIHNFRRVSVGWKEYWHTDNRYREGERFKTFSYSGKRFSIGLCGDLWTEGKPEEMRALNPDIILWPVWCDYAPQDWNERIKQEYAQQASLCGDRVLLVNPFCADPGVTDAARGGAVYFIRGVLAEEMPAGECSILTVKVE